MLKFARLFLAFSTVFHLLISFCNPLLNDAQAARVFDSSFKAASPQQGEDTTNAIGERWEVSWVGIQTVVLLSSAPLSLGLPHHFLTKLYGLQNVNWIELYQGDNLFTEILATKDMIQICPYDACSGALLDGIISLMVGSRAIRSFNSTLTNPSVYIFQHKST